VQVAEVAEILTLVVLEQVVLVEEDLVQKEVLAQTEQQIQVQVEVEQEYLQAPLAAQEALE
jgi:hypothetical protein